MSAATGLQLQLMLLIVVMAMWGYFKAVNEIRIWRAARQAAPGGAADAVASSAPLASPAPVAADLTVLPNAGKALANPPADLRAALGYMAANYPDRAYSVPLGWKLARGEADCVTAHLVDDVYHILLTAQSRIGKDVAASNILFALTQRYTPSQLQVCLIDGKGLDWAGWANKAHCWRLALDPEEVQPAMEALTAERRRRRETLQAAGVASWEEFAAQGGEMPLLVVYVSELLLLENATSKSELTSWLNAELTAAGAFGMRFIIACQTASNFSTQWRSQISLFLAGYQPAPSQDAPNTGLTTAELKAIGAIPPSELPGLPTRGTFTAVQGRDAATVRVAYIDPAQRKRLLDSMPNRVAVRPAPTPALAPAIDLSQAALLEKLVTGQPLPIGDMPKSVPGRPDAENQRPVPFREGVPAAQILASRGTHEGDGTERLGTPIEVPAEERAQILALAQAGLSRRKISDQLYGGRSKYDRVKFVLDGVEQAA